MSVGLITSADPNSAYSTRKSFPVSKFGYIPKSDTFQYLTVSDKFSEQKDAPNLYEIANQATVPPNDTTRYYVPAQSLYVKFHLYQHKEEELGKYQICLPKAIPGLKLKVIFTADLKIQNYPTTTSEPFKSSGWPTIDATGNSFYDDPVLYNHNRAKVNKQKLEVSCKDSDILRGMIIPFDSSPGLLPFNLLSNAMTIDVEPASTTLESILASHAELECVISGQWIAKFYGLWDFQ